MTVTLNYRQSSMPAAQREEQLRSAVAQTLKECFPDGWSHLSPLKREKILFNYIANHITYDHKAAQDSKTAAGQSLQASDAWSAYGALVERKAVCQGIACAFKLLCDQVDIPSLVVIGSILKTKERHAWNIVRIEGHFYHVDCTWMLRSSIDTRIPFRRYRYFNIPDPLFEDERTTEMSYLPACRSMRHNPFFIKGLCASNENETAENLIRQIKNGKDRFAVLCVGFRLTEIQRNGIVLQIRSATGKRVLLYLDGYFIGGYTF